MTTSAWLTLGVAALGLAGTLVGQLLTIVARRQELALSRRDTARELRRDGYAAFLTAARTLRHAALNGSASSTEVTIAISALRDAASVLELDAPAMADGALAEVLQLAERLVTVQSAGAAAQVVHDAVEAFGGSVVTLRQAMRADVGVVG
jgi:hypothetical protein